MFHEDFDEDDSNALSTDGSLGTKDITTTATTDTLVGTRVKTNTEMTRKLQRKIKHQQAMDLVVSGKEKINTW